jgi:hypothetical protein
MTVGFPFFPTATKVMPPNCCTNRSEAPNLGASLRHPSKNLLNILISLLPIALPRQRFLRPALLARLQIKRMSLNLFNDVFLLYFALETAQGAF